MPRTKREPNVNQPLLGATEAAVLLGWDRKRVAGALSRRTFPKPIAELASGPVWRREDLVAFAYSKGIQLPEGIPDVLGVRAAVTHAEPSARESAPGANPEHSRPTSDDVAGLRQENQRLRAEVNRLGDLVDRVRRDYNWALQDGTEKARKLNERDQEVRKLRRDMDRLETKLVPADMKVPDGQYNPGTSQALRALLEPENVERLDLAHEMAVLVDRWDPTTIGKRYYVSRSAIGNAIDRLIVETLEKRMQSLGRALAIELKASRDKKSTARDRRSISRARFFIKDAFDIVMKADSMAKHRFRLNESTGEVEQKITDYLRRGEDNKPFEEWKPIIR